MKLTVFTGLVVLLSTLSANGQNPEETVITPTEIMSDSLIRADTVPPIENDSLFIANDTLSSAQQDSLPATPRYQSDVETTIKYSARDSIIFSVDGRKVWLYGEAKIDYGDIKLDAEYIEIDWESSLLTATGLADSAGKLQGNPIFQDGDGMYETREIKYNFQTRKAFIKGVVTQQGEGYMHGNQVKMNEKNELFIRRARYTTCNLAHPHFYIRASKLKVIPDDKVVSGPFNLEIADVPTPIGFPFGMFPSQKNRTSGIIFPTYGEETRRGFFIREGGYFLALNDYMNLEVTGDIYSKGSWGVRLGSQYRKRYAFNGNFLFNYTVQNLGESSAEEGNQRDFRLTWSHTPQSRGTGRFSANINAVTSTYNQNNAMDVNSNSRATFSSNVSYSKTFKGTPFSMGLNGRFTQNVSTKEITVLLPEFSFNMRNIYPFQKPGGSANTWYERISLKWSMNGTNRINNKVSADSIAPFTVDNIPQLLQNARRGIRHQIPLSTSVSFLKYFTASPNINYTERWYFEKLDHRWDEEQQKVVTDTIPGFNRVYDYSGGVGINTRLYGTYFFNGEKIQAIRHVINPSVSFAYRPDFSAPNFDFYQEVQSNTNGDTRKFNRYQGFVYGSPGAGESQTLSFSISNNLEMKVRDKKDTVRNFQKVKLFNNLSLGSAYNFLADSFKLSNISIGMNTSLFKRKLSVNLRGIIDPYVYILNSVDEDGNVNQRRIDEYAWNAGQGIGRLSNFNIALSTSLNPQALESQRQKIEESDATEAEKEFLLNNPEAYVDFDIPWDLRINYSFNLRKIGFSEGDIKQTLRLNGNVNVTPKTKVGFQSGYDFEKDQITDTSINVSRDLHCWTMQFAWRPFGRFQSFGFTIRAKSALLQDLKVERKSNFFDSF